MRLADSASSPWEQERDRLIQSLTGERDEAIRELDELRERNRVLEELNESIARERYAARAEVETLRRELDEKQRMIGQLEKKQSGMYQRTGEVEEREATRRR